MKKFIFGRCYKFSCHEDVEDMLVETVGLYQDIDDEPEVYVTIKINQDFEESLLTRNPAIHARTNHGMVTSFGKHVVNWLFDDDGFLHIDLYYNEPKGYISLINKLISIEYSSRMESFLQVLYELVLVPSVYFFSEKSMPVHAASLKVGSRCVLLAGTGGVGKSSAMLALKEIEGAAFISDDIVTVSKNRKAFGNMAWPKIYGYNCVGNDVKKELLSGRSWLDRIQFNCLNYMNPSRVRRKISPLRLFNEVSTSGAEITDVLYLFRENVHEMKVSKMQLDETILLTIEVLLAEYGIFHNHLYWEKYNSIARGLSPVLDLEVVKKNWGEVLSRAFSEARIFKISIPLDYDHKQYMKEIEKLFSSASFYEEK